MLKKQGYKVILYDASSNRDERFHILEKHSQNILWLDLQSKYIKKIFSEGFLTLYEIIDFDTT